MNTSAMLAGLATAAFLAGAWLIVVGVRGRDAARTPVFRSRRVAARWSLRGSGPLHRARRRRYALAAVSAIVVWLVTGWSVAGLLVGLGVAAVPYLFGGAAQSRHRIERLEGLEEWARRLADAMAAGSATVQTIVQSARNAPEAIAADVALLADRLATPRWNKAAALRQFADAFDDALADLVTVALQIAVSTHGSARVTDVLRGMAGQVSEEVESQRAIEADRAEPRSVARNILIILAVLVVVVVLAGRFTEPYSTSTGQFVLAMLGAVTFLALWWMRRLQHPAPVPRIFDTAPEASSRAAVRSEAAS